MAEEEYQAAVAETAKLAAHLPRIGVVGRRPPQGPSMPQRLFNHFRSPEAVLGDLCAQSFAQIRPLLDACKRGSRICQLIGCIAIVQSLHAQS